MTQQNLTEVVGADWIRGRLEDAKLDLDATDLPARLKRSGTRWTPDNADALAPTHRASPEPAMGRLLEQHQPMAQKLARPGDRQDSRLLRDVRDGYGWEKLFSERMCRHLR